MLIVKIRRYRYDFLIIGRAGRAVLAARNFFQQLFRFLLVLGIVGELNR